MNGLSLKDFREGTEKAFSQVFRALYPAVCYYALRITNDQTAAEDIAGEAFLKLWDRREQFHHFNVLKSYLYTTTRNASINWLNVSKRQHKSESEAASLNRDDQNYVLHDIIRAETLLQVYTALDRLPPQCRKIMTMLYIEGKNVRQVAEELGLGIGTIKTQKARGLTILREQLPEFLILLPLLSFGFTSIQASN